MEDKCICCGAIVPEGRWVCPTCESNPPKPTPKDDPTVRHTTKKE